MALSKKSRKLFRQDLNTTITINLDLQILYQLADLDH